MKFIALFITNLQSKKDFFRLFTLSILVINTFTFFSCVSSPIPTTENTQQEKSENLQNQESNQNENLIVQDTIADKDETSLAQDTNTIQSEGLTTKKESNTQSNVITSDTFISIDIAGSGTKSVDQLYSFFLDNNPKADKDKVYRMATYYVEESYKEGINSDIAFTQMCLETGFLRFGGLVSESMNNFCGLGSINAGNIGASFETEQDGVRAHVQHLQAYGTTTTLIGEVIDPRYHRVIPRGKAPTVFQLSGTWAADKSYGDKLYKLLYKLSSY